jgi:hypothetical protein
MKYVIVGRVHPERGDVHFLPSSWKTLGGGLVLVQCDSSQITVSLTDVETVDGYIAAFLLGRTIARTFVASLGFALGTGYTVEMLQVIDESGNAVVFGTRPSGLGFEPSDPVFVAARSLAGVDPYFRLALHDYMEAFSSDVECAFFCYRAIEAIQASYPANDDSTRWSAMHAALGTNRSEIDSTIKQFADPVRHGNWVAVKDSTASDRFAMLLMTRKVLRAYLDTKILPGDATGEPAELNAPQLLTDADS